MFRRFAVAFLFLAGFSVSAAAQSCNSPSGFVQSFGTFSIGDLVAFGPDCNHLQTGVLNIALTTLTIGTATVNAPNGDSIWQLTGTGNLKTTAFHVNPGTGTLSTGTITELVIQSTNAQAFGGNYGRASFTTLGSVSNFQFGIFGEYGGTTATGRMGPFIIQNAIENPPATFTNQFFFRGNTTDGGSEASRANTVGFGTGDSVPLNKINLNMITPGSPGTRDSHSILFEGTWNNGSPGATWWRETNHITSNSGASSFIWQSNLNGGGWNTRGALSDTGNLTVNGVVGTTTNNAAPAGDIGEYIFCSATSSPSGAPPTATVTITIASPAVITWTAHGLSGNSPVVFSTTGTLPTGIVAGTVYYVVGSSITSNTFQIATTIPNAIAGTSVNTSGSQSGTQTGTNDVPLTTNTPANICAISLPAGDWEVRGKAAFTGGPTTTVNYILGSISLSSATLDQGLNRVVAQTYAGETPFATLGTVAQSLGPDRVSLASTTTVFLVEQSGFGTSTNAGGGFLAARRAY